MINFNKLQINKTFFNCFLELGRNVWSILLIIKLLSLVGKYKSKKNLDRLNFTQGR